MVILLDYTYIVFHFIIVLSINFSEFPPLLSSTNTTNNGTVQKLTIFTIE